MAEGRHVLINAWSTTTGEKPTFRDGMLQWHCLIFASYYFEWERCGKGKTTYAIRVAGSSVIYIAGIYHICEVKPEFLILQCEPAESIVFIHNRMPVPLPRPAHHPTKVLRAAARADETAAAVQSLQRSFFTLS